MRLIAPTLAAVAALALSGCVSVFPKSEPAQLYRFGSSIEASAGVSGSVPMTLARLDFTQAAAGDRIMTVTGSEVAYIAAARWAAPASVMFHEALEQSFERRARVVDLVSRRERRGADLMLDVDVNAFEARYENGREAAPTAVVSLDARIIRLPERTVIGQRSIDVRRPAGENRMGAIVAALDGATGEALGELVQWADANAR